MCLVFSLFSVSVELYSTGILCQSYDSSTIINSDSVEWGIPWDMMALVHQLLNWYPLIKLLVLNEFSARFSLYALILGILFLNF